MEIAVEENVTIVMRLLDHLQKRNNLRTCLEVCFQVLSVEIKAGYISSSVAIDDSIDVDHRHYLKDEILS